MRTTPWSALRILLLFLPFLSAPGSVGEAVRGVPKSDLFLVVDHADLFALALQWGDSNLLDHLFLFLESRRNPSGPPLDLEMVSIPAGAFQMGNTESPRDVAYGDPSEYPRHSVTLDYDFLLGKYEIANRQFAEMLNWALAQGYLREHNNIPYVGNRDPYYNLKPLVSVGPVSIGINPDIDFIEGRFQPIDRGAIPMAEHPVTMVTWYGALAFCNWASEREGLPPAYDLETWTLANRQGGGYRLPSESEWEYACRGAAANPNRYEPFSFGDDPAANLNLCGYSPLFDQHMVYCGNDAGHTSPVGEKQANVDGLHDMHGNVSEWQQDHQHASYDEPGRPDDGSPWMTGDTLYRVLRRGSWENGGKGCRSAMRGSATAGTRLFALGFRVARG